MTQNKNNRGIIYLKCCSEKHDKDNTENNTYNLCTVDCVSAYNYSIHNRSLHLQNLT